MDERHPFRPTLRSFVRPPPPHVVVALEPLTDDMTAPPPAPLRPSRSMETLLVNEGAAVPQRTTTHGRGPLEAINPALADDFTPLEAINPAFATFSGFPGSAALAGDDEAYLEPADSLNQPGAVADPQAADADAYAEPVDSLNTPGAEDPDGGELDFLMMPPPLPPG